MTTKQEKIIYRGTGRRKNAVANVMLTPGTGNISVNKKAVNSFFPYATLVQDLEKALVATGTRESFDITIKVKGGGFAGQAGACRLGIARALLQASPDYRTILHSAKLLTRDSRVKERKKYGLNKARRAPQFSKR